VDDPTLEEQVRLQVELMRAQGMEVHGPVPMSRTQVMATADKTEVLPGHHVQVGAGARWVEGFGGTPLEALRDAQGKLTPYDPSEKVHPAF